jgi:hypothetical protein
MKPLEYTAPARGGVIEKFVEQLVVRLNKYDYEMLYEHTDKIVLGDIFASICDLIDMNVDVSEYTKDNKKKVLA